MENVDILLRLIIAHLLADFVFQTDKINKGKKEGVDTKEFWLHILIVGISAYIVLTEWTEWRVPLLLMVVHGLIDWAKIAIKKDNIWLYIGDQLLHLISIIFIWSLFTSSPLVPIIKAISVALETPKVLIVVIAYLTITLPIGYLNGYLTKVWRHQITDGQNDEQSEELKNAGKTIGIIERILILTFILLQLWQAIGFLLAAKSVFRFGDLKDSKDRNKTEYILIGTLLSFTFSVILGILTIYLMESV